MIQKTFGACRFVFNYYLFKRIEMYKDDKLVINYNACSNDLTQLKNKLIWLKEIDSTALQSSLKDLDTAYQNFFRSLKKENSHVGFPKFKSKKNNRKSYKSKMNIKLNNKTIYLPKLGLIKCKNSKQIEGRIISATVSQVPSGKYFVSILCTDVIPIQLKSTGLAIGIDLGIKEFAVTSDNIHIENQKFLNKSEKKLAKLQRKLSRKTIGSSNREKARIKVAKQYEKITNQKMDFLHKISTQIIRDYDIICLEDLQIKSMIKNRRFAKDISDVSWGEFIRQLKYKSNWYGKIIQQVNTYYASSQTCNICEYKNKEIKNLNIRDWICPNCGTNHDRDLNASINILNEGLKMLII